MAVLTTWPDGGPMSHAEVALVDRIRPGTLLAGRYRLQEQVQADADTALWRAEDQTLERSVAVRVLSSSHPRVQDTLDAARGAAMVDDRRLQRVLGVGVEAGSGYVVLEWVAGEDAAALAGQVDEPEALRVVTEAAEALRTAAARGLHHGRLTPRQLLRAPDGRVRVLGTAVEVAAVGQATPAAAARPEARDVRDLGGLLYALLTGRWPFGADEGLPAAPTDRGRPVPAGSLTEVSPALEALLSQTLGGGGPDTLDELVEQLRGCREATAADGGAAAGGAAAEPGPSDDAAGDPDDDTDVLPPARREAPAAGAGAVGAAAAGAGAADGAAAAGAGAAGGAAGQGATGATVPAGPATGGYASGGPGGDATAYVPRAERTPAPTGPYAPSDDDGWDLLPVGDGWEDPGPDPGPGAWVEDETWQDDQRWDSEGPFDDLAVAAPAAAGGTADVVPHEGRTARRRPAGAGTGVAVVLVMAAFVVATLIWALDRVQDDPVAAPSPPPVTQDVEPSPEPSAPPEASEPPVEDAPQVITPAGVQALDPEGDGEENDQDAPRAIDGDPASVWTTQRYNSQDFGGLKEGLGLALDLGEPRDVVSVQVTAPGDGGSYEIRTAPGPSFDGSTVIVAGATGDQPSDLAPEAPVATQYLLVWFTALPQVDGDWRGVVGEVQVQVR